MQHEDPITCPVVLSVRAEDGPGIVAHLANAIVAAGGNIVNLGQHSDVTTQSFAARIEIAPGVDSDELVRRLDRVDRVLPIEYEVYTPRRARLVVACSSELHVLADILARVETGELNADVTTIISDRLDAVPIAERHGIPFVHVPANIDRAEEGRQFIAAVSATADPVVVLARYMRILPDFVADRYFGQMINIHHSFLPDFIGAKPYESAFHRGVKMVGATAHYVTPDLDEGPIIVQDVTAVSHADSVADLARRGRDIERTVLSRALRLHLEHRVMVIGTRTCVFD
jgi:formyltetrahydrofolate deformylase